MSTPSRKEMLEHLRNHYGLTLSETMDIVNIPLHPNTMRDDFAKAALQGIVFAQIPGDEAPSAGIARYAYELADAMLKERIK